MSFDEGDTISPLKAAQSSECLFASGSTDTGTTTPGGALSDDEAEEAFHLEREENFRLVCGTFQVPHPKKVEYGGEDSFFACTSGSAVGIADGVSEWGWRFGMNPRHFADALMDGTRNAAEQMRSEGLALPAQQHAQRALAAGFASVCGPIYGSATAIVATLDASGSQLGVANLGDSGLRQLRRSTDASCWGVVGRTGEQLHEFNRPFQLTRIPTQADFPRLLAEGKKALVQAVKRCPKVKLDLPDSAELYSFELQEGDLIVLGSDGLFDNLHDSEICALVDREQVSADVQSLAASIAQEACRRSSDSTAETPFCQAAERAGHHGCRGGLVDDITVLVARAEHAT